jgi:hypothetical protein
VLLVLLAFQLVVGLQWQVAGAVSAQTATPTGLAHAAGSQVSANMGEHCSMHAHSNGVQKQSSTGSHHCCHAGACQCQCVGSPAAASLAALMIMAPAAEIPALLDAPLVPNRVSEFLRPPIA